jgi:hypothetical protein
MLKRREDSQIVIRPILKQVAERIESSLDKDSQDVDTNTPDLTVIAHPVFPHRPIISTGEIYDFAGQNELLQGHRFSLSRVAGGVYARTFARGDATSPTYRELNEYGIVYQRFVLRKEQVNLVRSEGKYITFDQFVRKIGELIYLAQSFYEKCEYSGNIKITAKLRQILKEPLVYDRYEYSNQMKQQQSADSEISASTQYLPRDLVEREKFIEAVDELAGQLLWAFDVDDPQGRRGTVETILNRS